MALLKKLYFIVFLLTFMNICGLSAQTLVLHHANGTTTDIELYTKPQVKFQNDKVLITSTVLDMEYPKQNVLRITYKGIVQGINNVKSKANISEENNKLIFRGIKSTDKIAVYTANGIRVPTNIQRSESTASLTLSSISKGVYILSVNGKTSKFTKQ